MHQNAERASDASLRGERAWASTPLEHWGVAGRAPKTRESTRRRRRGEWGLCPFPENLWIKTVHWAHCRWKWQRIAVFRSSAAGKKIKHLSKYWGVVNTGRPLQVKYWVSRPLQPLRRWRLWRGAVVPRRSSRGGAKNSHTKKILWLANTKLW